jgi:RNA polymerase sigma-B factor
VKPTVDGVRDERDTATARLLLAYRKDGDTRARDRLVQLYLPLVETLARRHRGPQAEFDDLLQAGSIGLLNAIERFDPSRGDEFAAFAVPTIAGEMKRHLRDRTSAVRLPRRLQEASAQLPAARERLSKRLGRLPTEAELAAELGVDLVDLANLEPHSHDSAAPPSQAKPPEGDRELALRDERLRLAGAFEILDEQEREIVFLRFVEDLERREVADRLGISESQLGRRSREALAKLRRELEEDGLRKLALPADQPPADQPPADEPPADQPPAKPPAAAAKEGRGGHSGRLLLRMPRSLHDDLAEAAEREGISLNRFITGTLTAVLHPREQGTGPADPEQPDTLHVREVPRWLPAAVVVNIVVVVIAVLAALVLLVIAWQM